MLNQDYREMLSVLSDNNVRFLVVGAYAMAGHGYPRATGDIDIWVEPSEENSEKVCNSLIAFGAPGEFYNKNTFEEKGIILQIGVAPRRIDILTHIGDVEFREAWDKRKIIEIEGLKIPIIGIDELIRSKLSAGRDKDIADVKKLKNKT